LSRNSHGQNKIELLKVGWDRKGIFLDRPNRFIGIVDIDGSPEKVHIHDPGRLEELLYKENEVLLKHVDKPDRKTRWELIASRYENQWVFTNSGYHRRISENIVERIFENAGIRAEVKVGHSRLDFLVEEKGGRKGVEVKGCTLTENGVALFPDAPTERGRKHLQTLMDIIDSEDSAMLMILVFRKDIRCFAPNERTAPRFAEIFKKAVEKGVEVRPMLLEYDGESVWWLGEIGLC